MCKDEKKFLFPIVYDNRPGAFPVEGLVWIGEPATKLDGDERGGAVVSVLPSEPGRKFTFESRLDEHAGHLVVEQVAGDEAAERFEFCCGSIGSVVEQHRA